MAHWTSSSSPAATAQTAYDVLDPTSISGRFSSASVVNAPGLAPNVTYTSTGVYHEPHGQSRQRRGSTQPAECRQCHQWLLQSRRHPAGAASSGYSSVEPGTALSQLSGEAATGAEQSAFQLTDEFCI